MWLYIAARNIRHSLSITMLQGSSPGIGGGRGWRGGWWRRGAGVFTPRVWGVKVMTG